MVDWTITICLLEAHKISSPLPNVNIQLGVEFLSLMLVASERTSIRVTFKYHWKFIIKDL